MSKAGNAPRLEAPPSGDRYSTRVAYDRGTHRVVEPAATVARMRRMFGPLGITRVANVTGLDCIGVPVVVVCRPNGRSLAVSQGKGVDLAAAQAFGVMEAIELHHAERILLPLKLASFNEMRSSHDVAPVETLPRTRASTFELRQRVLWIEGEDAATQEATWLPYELVHTDFTMPFPTGSGAFVMSSNGLASGNHPIEAKIHALCEVIERDATTLFHCQSPDQQEALRLDLDSIDDADCLHVLDLYRAAGVAVGVWDVTSDISVPAFRCVIADREPNAFRPVAAAEGMGCHASSSIALLRALTEAAQSRLTIISGSRDDNGRLRYTDASRAARVATDLQRRGARCLDAAATFASDDLEVDFKRILEALRRVHVNRVIVVDLTKPEFEIPVVRVVVPGLETYHHVPGYIPGERARRVLASRAAGSHS